MRLSVIQAAALMNKSAQFVRIGLQRDRLDFGVAVQKDNGRWSYHISPHKFCEYMGMTQEELKNEVSLS